MWRLFKKTENVNSLQEAYKSGEEKPFSTVKQKKFIKHTEII